MENENVTPVDPGSPLFLSGDGFEPTSVFFPHAVFHFPSREKKEAYDFIDKELRFYYRDPEDAPDVSPCKRSSFEASECIGMDFNLRCSESMPDFSRIGMMDEDVPTVPSRRPSPLCGFFRSQIRAPCALIKDLPDKDQEIAMAFIKALAIQHRKLSLEKKKLRKKIHRMQRRVTAISRDLHILSSHPGEWIELGISEFARITDCMMPILDLAGQGVQVFCSPGGFP
ncbi:uncharacterized protein LOC110226638 isoform X2 [Arabidopsis lyrata subsp. lyrata]|uniref:uncharacterized protein LOC110226638 isoform X2 n=1 Tax=Arabidopsis lyrata subsp. lyrata TaxID=81972 RepID=UPI000A29E062|nr:uncharacterized protein LOC110226638 isoform X2 [Arabidopsis lyrata subsp. lyrata]|eukprot:XP_020874488.1 uncharacterized protein LOC110226638 isoform X2 [Arabidopsis lyrata subsp. lyrata]